MNCKSLCYLLLAGSLLFISCNDRSVKSDSANRAMPEDSVEAALDNWIEKRVSEDPELAELREAAMKLSEYIRLDGDRYVLDISEEEASALGISHEAYRYQLNELKKTNDMIAAAKLRGDSIELVDIEAFVKERKLK